MHLATGEFERMVRDLENARKRLRDQLSKLDEEEKDARQEIEQELRILQGRLQSLSRTTALEILTDRRNCLKRVGWLGILRREQRRRNRLCIAG